MKKEGFSKKRVEQRASRRGKTMSPVVAIERCFSAQQQRRLLPNRPFRRWAEFTDEEVRMIQELESGSKEPEEYLGLLDDEED